LETGGAKGEKGEKYSVIWIQLAQNMVQWKALVIAVTNLGLQ
jgi:hypothetical protein